MPYDGSENDWREGGEPPRETIVHAHPSLPFIEIRQTRHVEALPGEEKFEESGIHYTGAGWRGRPRQRHLPSWRRDRARDDCEPCGKGRTAPA